MDPQYPDMAGLTAIDLAIEGNAPGVVRTGGAVEVDRWSENMEEIIRILIDHGAKSGSGEWVAVLGGPVLDNSDAQGFPLRSRNAPLARDFG